MTAVAEPPEPPGSLLERHRASFGAVLALTVTGYLAYAVWSGLHEATAELAGFRWGLYGPILALTLVNYGLRFLKWAWLLRALGVSMPTSTNAWTFLAGLGMVVSPGKAGELIKPYVVREVTGTPMTTVVPALFAERLTDAIAVVLLAGLGVTTFYPDQTPLLLGTLTAMALGILLVLVEPVGAFALATLARLQPLAGLVARLDEALRALRICLSPASLLWTVAVSLNAWWAECVGYWLVFRGLGVDASLEAATFLYCFATVFGAPSPGGVGMADLALVEGALYLLPGTTEAQAFAAALLVRVATLWFGVILGAVALFRMDVIIRAGRARLR
jgi:uncharacterized protein (TIRG00374 family)